jgi:hypothetical protein
MQGGLGLHCSMLFVGYSYSWQHRRSFVNMLGYGVNLNSISIWLDPGGIQTKDEKRW